MTHQDAAGAQGGPGGRRGVSAGRGRKLCRRSPRSGGEGGVVCERGRGLLPGEGGAGCRRGRGRLWERAGPVIWRGRGLSSGEGGAGWLVTAFAPGCSQEAAFGSQMHDPCTCAQGHSGALAAFAWSLSPGLYLFPAPQPAGLRVLGATGGLHLR